MLLERKCPYTGRHNLMELPLTDAQYTRALDKWEQGAPIQVAFSMLTPMQREFILTGITPEKWHEIFGDEE